MKFVFFVLIEYFYLLQNEGFKREVEVIFIFLDFYYLVEFQDSINKVDQGMKLVFFGFLFNFF